MAKASAADEPHSSSEGLTTFEARLLRVLALHLVHERPQADQVDLLTRAGFPVADIAGLLDTTPNAVAVVRYQNKRAKKAKGKKKPKGY